MNRNLSRAQFVYASPERQREVSAALEPLLPQSKSRVTRDRNKAVTQAITFSSVQPEHLQGMTGIVYKRSDAAHAQYRRSEIRGSNPRRVVDASVSLDLPTADNLRSGNRDEREHARRALIHEIGHHVHAQNDHDSYYSAAYTRTGHSEALAENFADKHARSQHSDYDEIANAQPGDEAYDTRRRWSGNIPTYVKHRTLAMSPSQMGMQR